MPTSVCEWFLEWINGEEKSHSECAAAMQSDAGRLKPGKKKASRMLCSGFSSLFSLAYHNRNCSDHHTVSQKFTKTMSQMNPPVFKLFRTVFCQSYKNKREKVWSEINITINWSAVSFKHVEVSFIKCILKKAQLWKKFQFLKNCSILMVTFHFICKEFCKTN